MFREHNPCERLRKFSDCIPSGWPSARLPEVCAIGQSTVSEYLKTVEKAKLTWVEVADWDEARLAAALLPKALAEVAAGRLTEPDFAAVHAELEGQASDSAVGLGGVPCTASGWLPL